VTPAHIARARRKLALVGRTRDTIPFFYCAVAEDGDPVLLLDEKRIPPREINQIARTARRKVFVRGHISRAEDDGSLLFTVDTTDVADFVRDLEGQLGDEVPGLRLARVTIAS
jgi:hypothetical protein